MLETIWFILWMLLWAVYFMLDGFDFGVGTLVPFLSKGDFDREIMHAASGPFWDGNEVWLIAAGGVTFAAFPKAYAVMFSTLYTPLLMLLFALILRAVAAEFRSKILHPLWEGTWDIVHFWANLVPPVLLGVAFANLFMGIPVDANGVFLGNLCTLLNPYGLAGGLFFLAIFVLHGALWLIIKTQGDLQIRAIATATCMWPIVLVLLLVFLALTKNYTHIFDNYIAHPVLFILPLIALFGLINTRLMLQVGRAWPAWISHCVFIVGVTFFGVSGLYPSLILSSIDPSATVTILNGASSPLTLKIMLAVVLVMVPIVLAYQVWMYRLFRSPITMDDLTH